MSYKIDFQPQLVSITLKDTLSLQDVEQSGKDVDEYVVPLPVAPPRLIDIIDVTGIHVNFDGIFSYVSKRNVRTYNNNFKSAIVTGSAVQFGFARMFQTLASGHPQITLQVFRDKPSAMLWLFE